MEPLGKKLQQARLAKHISLEEASRVTKIRPSRIEEIEAEDFSSFPSLAYAKGFLLIYGKFLEVDVTPYLEAFETSNRVTVDGYSYLQDTTGPAPPPIARRQSTTRPGLLPLFVGVGILVLGFYLMKLILDIQRIAPPQGRAHGPVAAASATPLPETSPSGNIIAPRAIPVEGTPVSEAAAAPSSTANPVATVQPVGPSPTEPEVRRAQPVHPEDLPSATAMPQPNDAAAVNRVEITPIRKTFLRVTVDRHGTQPAFEGWLSPSDPPLTFRAQHVAVKVLERGAIQVTKNGASLPAGDPAVTFE